MNKAYSSWLADFSNLLKWFGPLSGEIGIFGTMVFLFRKQYFCGKIDMMTAESYLDNFRTEQGTFYRVIFIELFAY